MVNECSLRGIYTAETKVKPTKKNLEPMLKQDLKGVIRPPALCYGDVMETMDSLNLGMYEVSFLSKTLLRSTLWNGFPTEIKTVNSILPFRKKPFILLLHLRTCSKPDTIFTVLVWIFEFSSGVTKIFAKYSEIFRGKVMIFRGFSNPPGSYDYFKAIFIIGVPGWTPPRSQRSY